MPPYDYYQPIYNQQAQVQRLQKMRDDINDQLAHIQTQQPQIQQTFITQGQQPYDIPARWTNNIDEVKHTLVYTATIFMDRNNAQFYIKDETGSIKTYSFTEVVQLDEKDIKIQELENKIKELEGGNTNGKSVDEHNGQSTPTDANEQTSTSKS